MIALLSIVTGFVSPWIGDVFKLFQNKQDNAHELQMLKESNKSQRDIAELNAQVGMAKADVEDVVSARRMKTPYGTKLLDAIPDDAGWVMQFVKGGLIFALAMIEVANGLMRPYAVYMILTLWASTKVATFWLAFQSEAHGFAFDQVTATAVAKALLAVWSSHDYAAMDYVIGFLFGSRHKLKEAGGK